MLVWSVLEVLSREFEVDLVALNVQGPDQFVCIVDQLIKGVLAVLDHGLVLFQDFFFLLN